MWNGRNKHADLVDPILRWVGGKRQLRSKLLSYLPPDVVVRRYIEPFLGAGSIYFAIQPGEALLSDANVHVMEMYAAIRDNPRQVSRALREYSKLLGPDHYYAVRDDYNRGKAVASRRAAQFIYLNRTCFNGIFRVNRLGHFNVPFGRIDAPWFPPPRAVEAIGTLLQSAELLSVDFEDAADRAEAGDFVYLDPPYPPLNGTSFFTHYTKQLFGPDDQRRVAEVFSELDRRGCYVLLTNADTPYIRELYRGYNHVSINVNRWVTCKATKHAVRELIVSNYPLDVEASA